MSNNPCAGLTPEEASEKMKALRALRETNREEIMARKAARALHKWKRDRYRAVNDSLCRLTGLIRAYRRTKWPLKMDRDILQEVSFLALGERDRVWVQPLVEEVSVDEDGGRGVAPLS